MLAGRLEVLEGIEVDIIQTPISYYAQFVPDLAKFQQTLTNAGYTNVGLQIGEDVCQIDLIACASPHWSDLFLGGTDASVEQIVTTCMKNNAWVMKQFVQTQPAIMYIVSMAAWKMFYNAYGSFIQRSSPLSSIPADNEYTLLQENTDPSKPCNFVIDLTIDGIRYHSTTRVVITPHFSYNQMFLPQFRLSPEAWINFQTTFSSCIPFLISTNGFTVAPGFTKTSYISIQLPSNPTEALTSLQEKFPDAFASLIPFLVDPNAKMAAVLDDLLSQKKLTWTDGSPGYLTRADGACRFCVNDQWSFPLGCSYGKPALTPPPVGYLEKIAAQIVSNGQP